jgi:hypothetical protein
MGRKTRDRTRQARRPPTGKTPDPTLASVIDRYTGESVKDIVRTKTQVLRAIKRYDTANQQCSTITSADIIAFANQLVSKVSPQTVAIFLASSSSLRDRPAGVGISA